MTEKPLKDFSISYPIAFDKNKKLIHISEAKKGEEYFCPECGGEMIPRLGEVKVHHFAHKAFSASCIGEAGYHAVAKWVLFYYFQNHKKLEFNVACDVCRKPFKIIEEVEKVEIEKFEENGLKPDVTVLFKSGEAMPCEVVYKHPIDDKKIQQYLQKKYIFVWWISAKIEDVHIPNLEIKFLPNSYLQIEATESSRASLRWSESNDRAVLYITENGYYRKNPQCFHNPTLEAYIISIPCWRCGHNTKVAKIKNIYSSSHKEINTYPDTFDYDISYIDPETIDPYLWDKFNKTYNTNLFPDYSKTTKSTYLMNHCSYCGAKIGDFFLDEEFMDFLVTHKIKREKLLFTAELNQTYHKKIPFFQHITQSGKKVISIKGTRADAETVANQFRKSHKISHVMKDKYNTGRFFFYIIEDQSSQTDKSND